MEAPPQSPVLPDEHALTVAMDAAMSGEDRTVLSVLHLDSGGVTVVPSPEVPGKITIGSFVRKSAVKSIVPAGLVKAVQSSVVLKRENRRKATRKSRRWE